MSDGLQLKPISIRDAKLAVRQWHRHLKQIQGARFAIAAHKDGRLVGVALVGNPPARLAQDGLTAEVTRVATDGTPNACSFLYARAKRAAQALGFVRVKTKTRPDESGASLRAVQAEHQGRTRAQQWDRPSRRRGASESIPKERWEL